MNIQAELSLFNEMCLKNEILGMYCVTMKR